MRKNYSADFKYRVALAALKGEETLSALSSRFGVHVSQIQKWKNQLSDRGVDLFKDKRRCEAKKDKDQVSKLHEKIGQLTVERDFLERALGR